MVIPVWKRVARLLELFVTVIYLGDIIRELETILRDGYPVLVNGECDISPFFAIWQAWRVVRLCFVTNASRFGSFLPSLMAESKVI